MASRLQDVILRGLAAAKPLATAVAPGTLYYSFDTSVTERSNGTAWESYADAGGGGMPGAHASTHAVAGSDPVNILGLAGYPGNAIQFLRADGAFVAPPAAPTRFGVIGLNIDGGTSVIATGVKGFLEIPFACTILGWTLLSSDPLSTVGSIVVDVWKDVFANFPPVAADAITAGAKPTISAANKGQGAPVGWNTTIAAGDILGFNVDSVTTLTKVTLTLKIQLA